MVKILIINTIGFGLEGISSVIVNYISHMDKNGLAFDFIVQPNIRVNIKKYLISLGNVIAIPDRKQSTWGYIMGLNIILKKKRYDVVHIHGNSGTMAIEAFLAKTHHVKRIIVHSHNMECNHLVLNRVLTPGMKILSTDWIACSDAAGKWLYGDKKFTVLNNAIDVERFRFKQKVRDACRTEYGLQNEFVIGHIGNFIEQKNHDFLLEVFKEFHKMNTDSRLMLASDGPRMAEIQAKVSEYGLEDVVLFVGRRKDVERLYCAMDVFVFPSLWEGLGMVLIEAQVNGLMCFASDVIPRASKITNNIEYMSINGTAKLWAEKIMTRKLLDRKAASIKGCKGAEKNCFNIKYEADKLREIYLSEL